MAESAEITLMPVWVRFPVLHAEYYTIQWLQRAGNKIDRALKVYDTTLIASRGKFVRVYVEIDLTKPLKAGYRLRDRTWRIQYEGLQKMFFYCGRYGHSSEDCQEKTNNNDDGEGDQGHHIQKGTGLLDQEKIKNASSNTKGMDDCKEEKSPARKFSHADLKW